MDRVGSRRCPPESTVRRRGLGARHRPPDCMPTFAKSRTAHGHFPPIGALAPGRSIGAGWAARSAARSQVTETNQRVACRRRRRRPSHGDQTVGETLPETAGERPYWNGPHPTSVSRWRLWPPKNGQVAHAARRPPCHGEGARKRGCRHPARPRGDPLTTRAANQTSVGPQSPRIGTNQRRRRAGPRDAASPGQDQSAFREANLIDLQFVPLRSSPSLGETQRGPLGKTERPTSKLCPATSYSPTQWPAQYHRRREA